jgi:hypothetical protein
MSCFVLFEMWQFIPYLYCGDKILDRLMCCTYICKLLEGELQEAAPATMWRQGVRASSLGPLSSGVIFATTARGWRAPVDAGHASGSPSPSLRRHLSASERTRSLRVRGRRRLARIAGVHDVPTRLHKPSWCLCAVPAIPASPFAKGARLGDDIDWAFPTFATFPSRPPSSSHHSRNCIGDERIATKRTAVGSIASGRRRADAVGRRPFPPCPPPFFHLGATGGRPRLGSRPARPARTREVPRSTRDSGNRGRLRKTPEDPLTRAKYL